MLRPLMHRNALLDSTVTDNRSCSTRFYFDTGGGFSLLMSEDFVGDSAILNRYCRERLWQHKCTR